MAGVDLRYLKAGVVVVVLAGLWVWEGVAPMFGGRHRGTAAGGRLRKDAANIALGLMNAGLVALLFAASVVAVADWAARERFGLLNRVEWPAWVEWALATVLFDAWMYGWHLANHKVPLLWRFHQVHHADAELDASSALRFHTGEIALSSIARLVILPLLGMSFVQLLAYELILQPIILLHHSNVRFPEALDRVLRLVIVTPRIHWVHHSKVRAETDSNYASVLSCWDRLFRTLRWKDAPELELGLPYTGERETRSLPRMLALPFRRTGRSKIFTKSTPKEDQS